ENAANARLSKKLVTLNDRVPLDVSLPELAVHEPDYKRLVAFLKAMEFMTLTRRVCEFATIDAAQIDADPKLSAISAREPLSPAPAPSSGAGRMRETALLKPEPKEVELTPRALAKARAKAASQAKFDRSQYEIVRDVERLQAWIARARELGMLAVDTSTASLDPIEAPLCGFALAVAPNEACYVPLGHRQGG